MSCYLCLYLWTQNAMGRNGLRGGGGYQPIGEGIECLAVHFR